MQTTKGTVVMNLETGSLSTDNEDIRKRIEYVFSEVDRLRAELDKIARNAQNHNGWYSYDIARSALRGRNDNSR